MDISSSSISIAASCPCLKSHFWQQQQKTSMSHCQAILTAKCPLHSLVMWDARIFPLKHSCCIHHWLILLLLVYYNSSCLSFLLPHKLFLSFTIFIVITNVNSHHNRPTQYRYRFFCSHFFNCECSRSIAFTNISDSTLSSIAASYHIKFFAAYLKFSCPT